MNLTSQEKIVRDRIYRYSAKEFQQLVWDILICHYPDLKTPKMQQDLGNDGYSTKEKTFFAVYAPESPTYDNAETSKKIKNDDPKNLGDYDKFEINWKPKFNFENWIFVTKDNLMGKPHQKITELNNNGDGITKDHWGLEKLVKLSMELNEDDRCRIFGLPSSGSACNEVETIMELIEFISKEANINVNNPENLTPDPEGKIYNRFAEHCKKIENEFKSHFMYSNAKQEAERAVGIDSVKALNKRKFLKYKSNRLLQENNNDPIVSLDRLTDFFEGELGKNGKKYDNCAIRYYLISEIISCNVFPN